MYARWVKVNCHFASHFSFVQTSDIDIGKIIGTIDSTCVQIRHIWDGKQTVGLHKWDRV